MRFSPALVVLLAAIPQFAAAQTNVPRFLASREPVADAKAHPPTEWSDTKNVLWKAELDGLGWSTPVIWGDRVYVTTCISTGTTAEPRKGLYLEDVDATKYAAETNEHIWKTICLNLNTGSAVWEHVAHKGIPAKPHHIKNTLASESCATDGEHVYSMFGNVGLYCYTMDGELVWSFALDPKDTRYGWGTSMSPIVFGDRIYFCNDNEEESFLFALNKRTGEVIWKAPRDEDTNYSTPYIWENAVRTEIVVSGINWITSYDLDGKELWKIKGKSILAIPTPFERFGNLYVTSGHVIWGENPFYAVKPGASGDISLAEGQTSNDYVLWYAKDGGPYHPTPLLIGEQIYVLLDRGFMKSYNAKTGELVYDKKRIPKGTAFTSSPWTYDNKLFCINENGVTFVIQLGKEFDVLYTNKLTDDDMCMATPVIVDDKLLIRTAKRIYCLKEGAQVAQAGE